MIVHTRAPAHSLASHYLMNFGHTIGNNGKHGRYAGDNTGVGV